jgi:hypothetical protein
MGRKGGDYDFPTSSTKKGKDKGRDKGSSKGGGSFVFLFSSFPPLSPHLLYLFQN